MGYSRPRGRPRVFKRNMLLAYRMYIRGRATARAGVRKALAETIQHLSEQSMDYNDSIALKPLEALYLALAQLDQGITPDLLAAKGGRRRQEEMNQRALELRRFAIAAVSAYRSQTGSTVPAASAYVASRLKKMGFKQMRAGAGQPAEPITKITVWNWYKKKKAFALRYARYEDGFSEFDYALYSLWSCPTADQILLCAVRELGSTRGRKG